MIHRQRRRADLPMTVMTFALRDERTPPVGITKFPRPLPLAADVRGIGTQV